VYAACTCTKNRSVRAALVRDPLKSALAVHFIEVMMGMLPAQYPQNETTL
jgi:hypothetical protein